jgi:hypothetical protein
MTISEFVDNLYTDGDYLDDVKVFIDRLLLRLFDTVSLMQFLEKVSIIKKDETRVIQLLFTKIPDEVIPDVQRIIAVPCQAYEFEREGKPFIAFEIPVETELFGDEAPDFSKDPLNSEEVDLDMADELKIG